MEILCKDVKENECLDYTDEEVIDITRAVGTYMSRLIRYLHEDGARVEIDRLIPCGSIVEKTKLLRRKCTEISGLEFDYLAVIKRWPDIVEIQCKHTCNGSMEIQYTVSDPESDNGEKDNLTNKAGDIFRLILARAVDERCKINMCAQSAYLCTKGNRDISSKGCSACTIYLRHGNLRLQSSTQMCNPHLEFVWTPKSRAQKIEKMSVFGPDFVDLTEGKCKILINPLVGEFNTILVDIHPVFELDASKIVNIDNEILASEILRNHDKLYLFPTCRKNCPRRTVGLCWRISTIEKELALMKMVSKDHSLAYMTLKFLTVIIYNRMHMIHVSGINISSYMIKMVFLHHTSKCNETRKGVEQCVFDMLMDLSEYFLNQHISHFYLKFNLFEDEALDISRWMKSIGFMFRSMAELLSKRNVHIDMSDIFKDCISLYLIVWGTDLKARQEAWTRVPMNNTEMLKTAVDGNMMRNIEKNLESFVHSRELNSAEDALKGIVIEHGDLQILSTETLKHTQFGNKLVEWLKDTYQKKKYRRGVYTF